MSLRGATYGSPEDPIQRTQAIRPATNRYIGRSKLEGLSYEIRQTWDGLPSDHEPYKFRMEWSFAKRPGKPHKRAIKVTLDGPLFEEPDAPPQIAGYCPNLWDYEVFELFFANDKDEYLEVEVGPHGHWLVYLLRGVRKPFNKGKDLPVEIIENAFANGGANWKMVFEIPVAYLPANVSKFNAYAIHGADAERHYDALYPVTDGNHTQPDFHRLQFFRPIELEKILPEGLNDRVYTDNAIGDIWL